VRLYDADANGIQDIDLVDEVGSYLHARCEAFYWVHRGEVACPACGTTFAVKIQDATACPTPLCSWHTTYDTYGQSLRNHYVHTGRATEAFIAFYRAYPAAKSYGQKMILIDQLIHSFHLDEKTSRPVKSVASKLLEGNKKDVVRLLDALSSRDGVAKGEWRRSMAQSVDGRLFLPD
jgi:hypothetical protein